MWCAIRRPAKGTPFIFTNKVLLIGVRNYFFDVLSKEVLLQQYCKLVDCIQNI
jgi:hypothetical protein